jgi:hypothetical protein
MNRGNSSRGPNAVVTLGDTESRTQFRAEPKTLTGRVAIAVQKSSARSSATPPTSLAVVRSPFVAYASTGATDEFDAQLMLCQRIRFHCHHKAI